MILTPDARPDYNDEYVYYEDDPRLGGGVGGGGEEDYYYYDDDDYENNFRSPHYFPEKPLGASGFWPKDHFQDGTLTSKGFKKEAENFIHSVFNPPFR